MQIYGVYIVNSPNAKHTLKILAAFALSLLTYLRLLSGYSKLKMIEAGKMQAIALKRLQRPSQNG